MNIGKGYAKFKSTLSSAGYADDEQATGSPLLVTITLYITESRQTRFWPTRNVYDEDVLRLAFSGIRQSWFFDSNVCQFDEYCIEDQYFAVHFGSPIVLNVQPWKHIRM